MASQSVTEQKAALRAQVLAGREHGHDCGHSHSQLLIDYSWDLRAKKIACYISFGDEPSTNVFLRHCQLNEQLELYVPRVSGSSLEWVLFNEEHARHPLGMSEPLGEATQLTSVDLMVVPALAMDRSGNRLGRGKGFYDRALADIVAEKIVALVHDDELMESVPVESHDFKIDGICTCSELLPL